MGGLLNPVEDQIILVHVPLSFRWHFRHVQFGIHEQGKLGRPANGRHILFRKDQLGDALPLTAQFALLAHPSHAIARIADGAQRAAVLCREGLVFVSATVTRAQTTWAIDGAGRAGCTEPALARQRGPCREPGFPLSGRISDYEWPTPARTETGQVASRAIWRNLAMLES